MISNIQPDWPLAQPTNASRYLISVQIRFSRHQRSGQAQPKIADGLGNWLGAEIFYCIRGHISSLRKQGHNVLMALSSLAGYLSIRRLTAE
jgi:hypothetical protein